jgi:hypothetical protein
VEPDPITVKLVNSDYVLPDVYPNELRWPPGQFAKRSGRQKYHQP